MSLIGRDGGNFLLFGMLTQIEDGKLFLEDEDAHVELDVSQCVCICYDDVDGVKWAEYLFTLEIRPRVIHR